MAIALDNIGNAEQATAALTLVYSHVVTSNTNGILVLGVQWTGSGINVSTVTYGAQSMTAAQVKVTTPTLNFNVQQWYLAAPNVGTANITVNMSATAVIFGESISLTGAAQTAPAVLATTSGTSLLVTNTITPLVTGSAVIDSTGMATATSTLTKGASQTQISNTVDATNARTGAASYQLGVSNVSTTMSWTVSGATTRPWGQQIVAISPFAVAAVASGSTLLMMGV